MKIRPPWNRRAPLAEGKSTDQSMRYTGTLDALRRIVRDEAGPWSISRKHTHGSLDVREHA